MEQQNSPSLEGFSQRYREAMAALCRQHGRDDLTPAFTGKYSIGYAAKILAGKAITPLPPKPGAAASGNGFHIAKPPAEPAATRAAMVENMRALLRADGITPTDEARR